MMRGYGWDGGGWGWGGWLLMAMMMVLFWGAVIAAVIAFVRYSGRGHDGHGHHAPSSAGRGQDQALRILEERFARGEIDSDEYTQRRDLLRAG